MDYGGVHYNVWMVGYNYSSVGNLWGIFVGSITTC